MMRLAVTTKSSRGMTLIEVMVAMAIMSMMVVAVWSSFNGTIQGMEVSERMQIRYSQIRNTMGRINGEFSMAYLSANRPAGEQKPYTLFVGKDSSSSDEVIFSTFAHVRLQKDSNESDQTVIQYFIATDPDDSDIKHLYRRESTRLTGDLPELFGDYTPAYILCENVESLEFRYWDQKKEDWEEHWSTIDSSGQPDRLPSRIEIKLGVRNSIDEVEYFVSQAIPMLKEKIDLSLN